MSQPWDPRIALPPVPPAGHHHCPGFPLEVPGPLLPESGFPSPGQQGWQRGCTRRLLWVLRGARGCERGVVAPERCGEQTGGLTGLRGKAYRA